MAFFEERGIGRVDDSKRSAPHRFAHFWLLVAKSFIRNRCPVRASALAYTTLLALIPLLAVGASIATSLLRENKEGVATMIKSFVRTAAPMLDLEVKTEDGRAANRLDETVTTITTFINNIQTGTIGVTGMIALIFVAIGLLRTIEATFNDIWGVTHGRGWLASIVQYWATIPLGPVVLTLVLGLTTGPYFNKTKRILGLSLVTTRDIKDVGSMATKLTGAADPVSAFLAGKMDRPLLNSLAEHKTTGGDSKPLRRLLADSLSGILESGVFYDAARFANVELRAETKRLQAQNPVGHELARLNRLLLEDAYGDGIARQRWPWIGDTVFYLLPFVVLSLAFALFYQLMPNTRVQPQAALIGGIVGGTLWQMNNKLSVLYVSKALSYSQVYGALSIIPLFLVGTYFSWLIMLLGAQVAYAYQNRQSYLQDKQAEGVSQRGREFVALRVMTRVAQCFQRGEKPPGVNAIASALGVPTRLVSHVVQPMIHARLLVEAIDRETGYAPARPLDQITAHEVLQSLRVGQGHELETSDDGALAVVRGSFDKIGEVERAAAVNVTLKQLVDGADAPVGKKDSST